ncbi:MAG: TonB family protein [Proteobacteria bacterium]|nr:TonB family protein [Pseudomonadota bacterium]
MGTLKVTNSADKHLIQKIIRIHLGEVRACYERELKKTKNISGRVVVQLTINPKGEVEKVSIVESTLNNKNVNNVLPIPFDTGDFLRQKMGRMLT